MSDFTAFVAVEDRLQVQFHGAGVKTKFIFERATEPDVMFVWNSRVTKRLLLGLCKIWRALISIPVPRKDFRTLYWLVYASTHSSFLTTWARIPVYWTILPTLRQSLLSYQSQSNILESRYAGPVHNKCRTGGTESSPLIMQRENIPYTSCSATSSGARSVHRVEVFKITMWCGWPEKAPAKSTSWKSVFSLQLL